MLAEPDAYESWRKEFGQDKKLFLDQVHKMATEMSRRSNGKACNVNVAGRYHVHVVPVGIKGA